MFKNIKLGFAVCWLVGAWSFALAAPAVAYPQIFPSPAVNGPSGLIRIPSADVVPYKNFNIGADFGTTVPSLSASAGTLVYKMNLGSFHGVEIGIVGGTNQTTQQLREGVFVNMKLALASSEDPDALLLAMGVENLFSYTQTDVYMVASKILKQGPRLTFGFMADFPSNKFRPLGLLGAEIPLGETFFLVSDFMLGETMSQLNAGAKLYFTPIFSLNLYGLNIFNSATSKDNQTLLLGFSWANPF
ncbi:hypothetical protein A3H38_01130 [candidate division WOR-1 bacterium RIFCSPLOWO2_02_FULL_46_20]|uniref:DUF5723 domain-containing protein n=1 Tax=candidate division WOR-1 bacterium RIFCSPLOWO2_02_FULL_46_20 TaxID=1802567 RepID=A0A1F4REB0_UNCSA|nr:MAG: hypothetical protein A3H38_01130 [candidate division WOR-1 bacterium RIFCSPLOWO2_02_FULL_46_20]